jgi:hypothetical protein
MYRRANSFEDLTEITQQFEVKTVYRQKQFDY